MVISFPNLSPTHQIDGKVEAESAGRFLQEWPKSDPRDFDFSVSFCMASKPAAIPTGCSDSSPAIRYIGMQEEEEELSPADDLFFKGQLLPLHLHPRLQMLERLASLDKAKEEAVDSNFHSAEYQLWQGGPTNLMKSVKIEFGRPDPNVFPHCYKDLPSPRHLHSATSPPCRMKVDNGSPGPAKAAYTWIAVFQGLGKRGSAQRFQAKHQTRSSPKNPACQKSANYCESDDARFVDKYAVEECLQHDQRAASCNFPFSQRRNSKENVRASTDDNVTKAYNWGRLRKHLQMRLPFKSSGRHQEEEQKDELKKAEKIRDAPICMKDNRFVSTEHRNYSCSSQSVKDGYGLKQDAAFLHSSKQEDDEDEQEEEDAIVFSFSNSNLLHYDYSPFTIGGESAVEEETEAEIRTTADWREMKINELLENKEAVHTSIQGAIAHCKRSQDGTCTG